MGRHPKLRNPLVIDFFEGDLARRARQANETLAKAVGASKGLHVVDATAGLGRDAFLMSAAGARVTAIEANSTLGFFLTQNAKKTDLTVLQGHAQDLIPDLAPDVVYLDPMFPHRRKSAAVGGESLFLQAFASVADLEEQAELLDCAWRTPTIGSWSNGRSKPRRSRIAPRRHHSTVKRFGSICMAYGAFRPKLKTVGPTD